MSGSLLPGPSTTRRRRSARPWNSPARSWPSETSRPLCRRTSDIRFVMSSSPRMKPGRGWATMDSGCSNSSKRSGTTSTSPRWKKPGATGWPGSGSSSTPWIGNGLERASGLLRRRASPQQFPRCGVRVEPAGRDILGELLEHPAGARPIRDSADQKTLHILEDLEPRPGDLPLAATSALVQVQRVLLNGAREVIDSAAFEGGGPDDRRRPAVSSLQLELQVRDEDVFVAQVDLVHHVDVSDLQDSGLHRLHDIAGQRHFHDDRRVRTTRDLHFALPRADRLDEDEVGAHRVQHAHRIDRAQGQTAGVASRGHRSDEHARIDTRIGHPDSISQDRAAGVRRRRVDGDDADRLAPRSEGPDQPVNQRALPDAGRSGQPHDMGAAGVREDPRDRLDRFRFIVLDEGNKLAGGPLVPFEKGVDEAPDGIARGLRGHAPHAPLSAFSKNETMTLSGVPGPKTALTPARFSFGTSSSGMIPPPTTTLSPDFRFFRRVTTSGNNVMCAPLREDRPIASTSSWMAASTMSSGVWRRPV